MERIPPKKGSVEYQRWLLSQPTTKHIPAVKRVVLSPADKIMIGLLSVIVLLLVTIAYILLRGTIIIALGGYHATYQVSNHWVTSVSAFQLLYMVIHHSSQLVDALTPAPAFITNLIAHIVLGGLLTIASCLFLVVGIFVGTAPVQYMRDKLLTRGLAIGMFSCAIACVGAIVYIVTH